jgi:hypothetical protein
MTILLDAASRWMRAVKTNPRLKVPHCQVVAIACSRSLVRLQVDHAQIDFDWSLQRRREAGILSRKKGV